MTTAHEFGHLFDHQGLGKPGEFASTAHEDLKEWRDAVGSSGAVNQLRALRDGGKAGYSQNHVRYLLEWHELWARSYAQYITVKGEDAVMKAELTKILAASGNPVYYPSQWAEADFQPILEAIDRLLTTKALLK